MDSEQTSEEKPQALPDESEIERDRLADQFRPFVLLLLERSRELLAEREAKKRERAAKRALRRGREVA